MLVNVHSLTIFFLSEELVSLQDSDFLMKLGRW